MSSVSGRYGSDSIQRVYEDLSGDTPGAMPGVQVMQCNLLLCLEQIVVCRSDFALGISILYCNVLDSLQAMKPAVDATECSHPRPACVHR